MDIPHIDKNWTLFLDRDGVINELLHGDYVKTIDEFKWLEGSREAIVRASELFSRIIIVTNQRGISKGVMTETQLDKVHTYLLDGLPNGCIDRIYYCPYEDGHPSDCRKPGTGMPLRAQKDFPDIDFRKSVIVGDSLSDILMGNKLGMITVHVASGHKYENIPADYHFPDLAGFIKIVENE